MPNGTGQASGAGEKPTQNRVVQAGPARILCVADVRGERAKRDLAMRHQTADRSFRSGNLKSLNELAKQARADYIIHTGDFGFYDENSLDRIAEK